MISNNRGSALIIGYMVIATLMVVGMAFVSRSIYENRNTRRYVNSVQAFWLAEAGIIKAVRELNDPDNLLDWPDSSDADVTVENVTISGRTSAAKSIRSTGIVAISDTEDVTRTINVIADRAGSLFTYAAFGKTSVTMSGQGEVNSYNSETDKTASNLLSNGDIGTNGDLTMSGQAFVNGDAGTGPDCDFEDEDHDFVSGTVSYDTNVAMSSITVPESLSSQEPISSITGTTSLASGDYVMESIDIASKSTVTLTGPINIYLTSTGNSLKVAGQAKIVVSDSSTGPVTIYTDGDISLAGQGITNAEQDPSSLLIYGTSSTSQTFNFSGQADFYGAVYAPNADINISGQGDLYGSYIGDTVSLTGQGGILYDENLNDLDTGMGSYSIVSWREER